MAGSSRRYAIEFRFPRGVVYAGKVNGYHYGWAMSLEHALIFDTAEEAGRLLSHAYTQVEDGHIVEISPVNHPGTV